MEKLRRLKEILSWLLALILVVEVFVLLELHKQSEAEIQSIAEQHVELQTETDEIKEQGDVYEAQIDTLTKQVRELQEKSNRSGEREPKLTSLGAYTVTGFCACEKCCGKWAKNRPNGVVYGAGGIELIPDVSVAAPLPIGTKLMIDGKEYIVHDRTAGWVVDKYNSKVIDIYKPTHREAWDVGNDKHEVLQIN